MDSIVPHSSAEVVILIDDKPLRRAAYSALLAPWASEMKLRLESHAFDSHQSSPEWALVIVIGGSTSVTDLQLERAPFEIARMQVPVVVFSDRDETSEIVAAMALGLKGFVPARLPADLALKVLTFILAGGDFFPPSALRSMTEAGHSGRRRTWKALGQNSVDDE